MLYGGGIGSPGYGLKEGVGDAPRCMLNFYFFNYSKDVCSDFVWFLLIILF